MDIKAVLDGTAQQEGDREHQLTMLGYNQALLDWATFPLKGAGVELARAEVERTVKELRVKLGK